MRKKMGVLFLALLLVTVSGCGKRTSGEPEQGPAEKKEVVTVPQQSPQPVPQKTPVPAASGQEKEKALADLDKSLNEVVKIMDSFEKVNLKDLEF